MLTTWTKTEPFEVYWEKPLVTFRTHFSDMYSNGYSTGTKVHEDMGKIALSMIYDKTQEIIDSIQNYEKLETLCYNGSRTNYFDTCMIDDIPYLLWIRLIDHEDDYNCYIKAYRKPEETQ